MSTENANTESTSTGSITLSSSRKALYSAAKAAWNLAKQIDGTTESLPSQILVDMCKQFKPTIPGAQAAIEELWNHGLIDRSTKGSIKSWSIKEGVKHKIKVSGAPSKNLSKQTIAALLKKHTGLEATNGAAKTASVPAPPAPRPEIGLSSLQVALFGAYKKAWTLLKERGFDGPGIPSSITTALAALAFPATLPSGMSMYAGKLFAKKVVRRHGSKVKALWEPLDVIVQVSRNTGTTVALTDEAIARAVTDYLGEQEQPQEQQTAPAEQAATPPKKEEKDSKPAADKLLKLGPADLVIFKTFKQAWKLLQQVDSPFHGVPSAVTNAINERYKPDQGNPSLITTQIARRNVLEKIHLGNVAHWKPTKLPVLEGDGQPSGITQLTRDELIKLMAETLPQVSDALLGLLSGDPEPGKDQSEPETEPDDPQLPVIKLSPVTIVVFRAFQRADHLLKKAGEGEHGIPSTVTNALVRVLMPERRNAPQVTTAIASSGALAKNTVDKKNFWMPQDVQVVRGSGPKDAPEDLSEEQIIDVLAVYFPDIAEALQEGNEADAPEQDAANAPDDAPDAQASSSDAQQEKPQQPEQPKDLFELLCTFFTDADIEPLEPYIRSILVDLDAGQQQSLVSKLTFSTNTAKKEALQSEIDGLYTKIEQLEKQMDSLDEQEGLAEDSAMQTANALLDVAKKRKQAADDLSDII